MAIIAGGGRAIIIINREAVEMIFFSFILLILLKPFDSGLVQPLAKRRLPGVRYFRPSKPCRWRGKWLHHGGDVCVMCLCLGRKKSSEREFFVPTRTDLGVKLLREGILISKEVAEEVA